MTIRFICLTILGAAVLSAQQKPAEILAALQDEAQEKSAAWEMLAADLETRLTHLLPCDPRVQSAIEEASRASEARLAALSQYLEAKLTKTNIDGQAISGIIARQEGLSGEMNTERAEAAQQRAAIEAESADLGESAKQSSNLAASQKVLEGIAADARKTATRTEEQSRKSGAVTDLFRHFNKGFEDRRTALETEIRAVTAMTARWHEYYAARLARAQTECSVINGGRPAGKK
jgi:hypothetical protein